MKRFTKPFAFIGSLTLLFLLGCAPKQTQEEHQADIKSEAMTVEKEFFGVANGGPVELYTLTNSNGMRVKITNYGGIVTSLAVPGKDGEFYDVVLGFDSLQAYLDGHPYFGCIVGRYANRIAGGEFRLDGQTHRLATNNGPNHLHGGVSGFDRKVWRAASFQTQSEAGVSLKYESADGEEGYPGKLEVKVDYALSAENEFRITYYARTDAPTVVNLTHHSYFNLNGEGSGNIMDHRLFINAGLYTPVDTELIPTGEMKPVAGGPFDFLQEKAIGRDIDQVEGGYDHNFVLDGAGELSLAARLTSPATGISMEVHTDQPGMQFYTGNFLDGTLTGKQGEVYRKHTGLCLETQHFPDSPNQPSFPSTVLRPGEIFQSTTIYRFPDNN